MTCYGWFKMELAREFVKQHIGMLKHPINIWTIMIKYWIIISSVLDANNLYEWAMFQKLRKNGFKWMEILSKFNEDFIKKYDENSNTGYFIEVDAEYSKTLFNSHKDLPFLPERKKIEKVKKLTCRI